jgi:ankyrin repeat protein
MLYQGVHANAICVTKGYSALIAAVYNSDLPMLKLIIQSDEICKQTYFSTQFSIISAILSIVNGTVDTLEADVELLVNADGITEGEVGGYLRSIGPNDPVHVSDDGEIKLVSKRNIVDLDQSGRNGMRALHYASQIGDIRIVGALLQAGAAREVFNDKLHTPLDVSLANDHIEAANAIRFDPERVSICLAAKHGDWTVMSALLCQGVSINTQRNHMSKTGDQLHHELFTPLLAAVAHGQAEVVKRILDVPGVNVNLANSLNQTALMFAAARGDESTVLLLLSRGADRWVLDKQGYIATAWAESRNRDAIAIILKHDPARIWIHDVIRNNDFAATIGMLKQNVDPNLRRMTQLVPHSPATIAGHGKLQMDSVSSSKTKTSKPVPAPAPVKAAAGIDQHHDRSSNGSGFIHGETPLIVAARYGRLDTIAILLKAPPPHAVDQTITDSAGNSALHHATLKGHEEAVLLLLKAHASRHLRNTMGLNPSAVAKSAGFVNIAAIIDADPYTIHIHDMCEQGNMRMVSFLRFSFVILCFYFSLSCLT